MLMRKEGNLTSLGKQGALCMHHERSQVMLAQAARGRTQERVGTSLNPGL